MSFSFCLVLIVSVYIYIVQCQKLPTLPKRFTAIVEANILNKNTSWIMEEWYDSYINKAKRAFYRENVINVQYEDFSDGQDKLWKYSTTHEDTTNALSCTLESYFQRKQTFGPNDEAQTGNLVSSQEWFLFGSEYNETYIGKKKIRGIWSEGWTRNISNMKVLGPNITMRVSYELTYYFSLESWEWFNSSQHRIPVRVELLGQRITSNGTYDNVHTFEHYYDYVQFFTDDLMLAEELDFDIPDFYEQCNVTAYCNVYTEDAICSIYKGPALPKIPGSFIATWEFTTNDGNEDYYGHETTIWEMYYDYDNNRAHTIWRGPGGYYSNAFHQLEMFEHEQRWMWYGDGIGSSAVTSDDEIRDCFMNIASPNFTGYDWIIPVEGSHIAHPARMFIFDDHRYNPLISDEIWMGYTTVRGIPAEKWKSTFNVVIDGIEANYWLFPGVAPNQRVTINGTIYWYFSSNWTFTYDMNDTVRPLQNDFDGIYRKYNYSDISHDWFEISNTTMRWSSAITKWLRETPSDDWFKPPTFYRKYCVIDDAYCNKDNHEDHEDEDVCDKGLDLPTLPKHKYFVVLEGNDITNDTSHIMKAWYNYDKNELRTEYYNDDNIVVTYDDLDEDRRWRWIHKINETDDIISCNVDSYKSTITAGTEQFSEEYIDTGHVKTAQDFWRFGEKYNVTYLGGDFEVRGIKARSWHTETSSNFVYNGTNTSVSWESIFYFATKDWDYYKAIEASDIPISVVYTGSWSNGIESGSFNTEYHIVSFFSGSEAFDESEMEFVFEDWYSQCDVSKYCEVYPTNDICSDSRGPKMPSLPDQFYAVLEGTMSSDDYAATFVIEEYYDYPGNEAHIILHSGPNWRGDTMHQLDRLDQDEKWIWNGDGDDADFDGDEISNCQLTPAINNFTGTDVFIQETNGHIASPSRWFRWNDSKYTTKDIWNGWTTVRGIPAQRWKTIFVEYREVPESSFQETYAIQMNATATYYWSNKSWNILTANWGNVPLLLELDGYYTLYNKSISSGKYDILWTQNTFQSVYNMMIFNAGEQDEDNFEIPQQYQQCNITLYCNKYPNSMICTNSGSSDKSNIDNNEGLSAGWIVLIIVLFFIGLLLGVIIDRCYIRNRKNVSFVRMKDDDKKTNATL